MKTLTVLLISTALFISVAAQAQEITPTTEYTDFYSSHTTINGRPIPVGSVIEAYDPQGVLCGRFVVHTEGSYGWLHVYGDDSLTPSVDEGASSGDTITFRINGELATTSSPAIWVSGHPGGPFEVDLSASISILPPSFPTLSSPANGATNRPTTLTLRWNLSSGATLYRLQVATDPSFVTGVFVNDSTIVDTSRVVSGLAINTTYYWRINAMNIGGTSDWSSVWSFTTAALPATPTLVSPVNEATGVSASPTLIWNASSGAVSYRVQVSTSSDFFTTVVDQSGITGTSYSVSGLANGTRYYWRVNATNAGGTSDWSSVWSFTTAIAVPPVPTLVSPPDDATEVPGNTTLSWEASGGAISYWLQVSTSANFSTFIVNQMEITTTSYPVSGLTSNTTYYWRVSAMNAGGASAWSNVWRFSTALLPPPAPILISPPDGATGVPTSLTLQWNATSRAESYRVQVSTNSGFSTTVVDSGGITGTTCLVGGFANNTRYYWRVNATNVKGTSDWSGVRNFTTIVETPTPPTLTSPLDSATGVSSSLTLRWNASIGATSYRVQVSTGSNFTTTIVDQREISVTSLTVSGLANNTRYYWHVNATNAGGTSDWSSAWSFMTIVAVPPPPILFSPVNGAAEVSTNPTLVWNASFGAVAYRVHISTSSNFSTIVVDSIGITGTSVSVSGLANNTRYYWRVNATNAGGISPWSNVWNFTTTLVVPQAPILVSPSDGATGVPTNPTLVWNASAGAISYRAQVSTDSTFGTTVVDQSSIAGTSLPVSGLANNTRYYWRVNTTNVKGTSGWSNVRSFTTIVAAPASPILVSPPDGATGVSINPTLVWNAVGGATSYRVQVSMNSNFSTTVVDQMGIIGTSYSFSGLFGSTTYYWRVNATSVGGTGDWSLRSFTTIITVPLQPTLSSPSNGLADLPLTPTLIWNPAIGATSYHVQVSASSNFSTILIDISGITATSYSLSALSRATTYYWRVSGINSVGEGNYSTVWQFRTIPDIPPPPVLSSPNDGAIEVAVSPTLTWNSSKDASQYHLQVSKFTDFSTKVFEDSTIASTSRALPTLETNTTYYWRVRAKNITGVSEWSSVWYFTTKGLPDLQVTQIQVPPVVRSGQSLQVTWIVTNAGDGATNAPIWHDYVWLSTDVDLRAGDDKLLGTFDNISYLNPGESYSQTRVVTLPIDVVGNYYLFVSTDNDDAYITGGGARHSHHYGPVVESNEDNNFAYTIINIDLTPPPDLQVTSLIAPNNAFSGKNINVSWGVKNLGAGSTKVGSWVDAVYLSQDTTLNFSNATELNRVPHSGVLDSTGSYTTSTTVTLPQKIYGRYYIFVVTDRNNNVYEHANEDNNTLRSDSLIVTLTPPPDLVVTEVVAPSTAASGQTIDVSWTVQNQGPGAPFEPGWSDRVYLSTNSTFNPESATVLGESPRGRQLDPDSNYITQRFFKLPNGISGLYYIYVKTDVNNNVFEHIFEGNNVSQSQSMEINLTPWPDLQVISVNMPDSAIAGENIPITWTVKNAGLAKTSSPYWVDRVYVAPVSDTTALTFLRDFGYSQPLDISTIYTQNVSLRLPGNLSGNFFIYVRTDVSNLVYEHVDEGNNLRRSNTTIIVKQKEEIIREQPQVYPSADLTVESISVPDSVFSGQTISIQWMVKNIGPGRTLVSGWHDAAYLSTDTVLGNDPILATTIRSAALDTNENYARNVSVTLPNGISGNYYIIVKTDIYNAVNDTIRNNNTRVSIPIIIRLTPPPDLQVTSLTAPSQATAGQPIQVRWTVQNNGSSSTVKSSWYDAIYLSNNTILDGGDTRLGIFNRIGELRPTSSYSESLLVNIPSFVSGTYCIIVQTDSRNDIYEHNFEDNNVKVTQINITLPPASDLVVSSISVPDSAILGEVVTISWTIRNRGVNPAVGLVSDGVYISADTVWQVSDPLAGVYTRNINLAPRAKITSSFKVNLSKIAIADSVGNVTAAMPGVVPGNYRVIVRTDIRNNIQESDNFNNTLASQDSMAVDCLTLQVGVPYQSILETAKERYFSFNAAAGEDYQVTLDADAGFNELFVRSKETPSRSQYDYIYDKLYSPDQKITIPNANAGKYYILVRGDGLPVGGTNFTLLVTKLEFVINPPSKEIRIGNLGEAPIEVHGAKFQPGAKVFLRRGNITVASNLNYFVNSTRINARFPMDGLELGQWDVVVVNPDSQEVVLPGGVILELPRRLPIKARIVGPPIRPRFPSPSVIHIENPGNTGIPIVIIIMETQPGLNFNTRTDPLPSDSPDWDPANDVTQTSEGNPAQSLIMANIGPGESRDIPMSVQAPDCPNRFGFSADVYALNREDMSGVLQQHAQDLYANGLANDPFAVAAMFEQRQREISGAMVDLGGAITSGAHLIYGGVPSLTGGIVGGSPTLPITGGSFIYDAFNLFRNLLRALERVDRIQQIMGGVQVVCPQDPNDIVGPEGYGAEKWIAINQTLPYTIHFENDSTVATAPAQVVSINFPIDPSLDIRSFRLGSFGFGNFVFNVPENVSYYTARLDVRDSLGVYVDVNAGLDVNAKKAFWVFKSIDPATGEKPVNPLVGFLPVNDSMHRGQGFVNFTIRPSATSHTGDVIDARASIVFDTQNPIDTPPIFNTVDAGLPISRVRQLPVLTETPQVLVRWSGVDDSTSSGIQSYSIFVSENNGPFAAWLTDVSDTSATYIGKKGSNYQFYSIARDNSGNTEEDKFIADAFTTIISDVPSNPIPPDSAENVPITTKLKWTPALNAISYNLYLWKATEPKPASPSVTNLAVAEYIPPSPLDYQTLYKWQVLAIRAGDSTSASEWDFTTIAAPAPPPTSWAFTDNTGSNASIAVPVPINPTIGAQPLRTGDAVGVFFGRNDSLICAGFSIWQEGQNMAITAWGDDYLTPLKDGFWENELIRYKIWDSNAQREYFATATYQSGGETYVTNGFYVLSSLIGNTAVAHGITLPQGWNTISSFVQPSDSTLDRVLSKIRPKMVIMKSGTGQVYWPFFNINQIGKWNYRHGYQVYMQSADIFTITGDGLDPQTTPISLGQKWNLTAYLRNSPMIADSALASIVGNLVIVKNSAGKVYWPAFNINTIGSMMPGQGYQMYLKQASTLTYPANSGFVHGSILTKPTTIANATGVASPIHYSPSVLNTGANAILLVKSPDLKEGDEIAVWTGKTKMLVGSGIVINQGRAIITIWGDNSITQNTIEGAAEGESLSLTLWSATEQKEGVLSISSLTDALTGEKVTNRLCFKTDAVWAARLTESKKIPTVFSLAQNYPNPFNPSTVIKYGLPRDVKVTLEVFNVLGQRIALLVNEDQKAGYHQVIFQNPKMASGVYLYRLQAGEFVEIKKMVIVR